MMASGIGQGAQRPGSPRRSAPPQGDAGFTLLEMVLVLTVIVVVASLAVPRLAGSIASARVTKGTERLFAAAREAHARAVLRGLRTRLVLDREARAFWVEEERQPLREPGEWSEMPGREEKPYTLAEGVRFGQIRIDGEEITDVALELRFRPDGTADDALVTVENEDGDIGMIEVRGLTGRVRILRSEKDRAEAVERASGAAAGTSKGQPSKTQPSKVQPSKTQPSSSQTSR